MQQHEYARAVHAVLAQHTERAIMQLRRALDALPGKARAVTIDVMVDQESEGFLTVRVGVEGPDLYVLNKAIAPYASLFDTVMTETELSPDLPLMEGSEFNVGVVLTDCAASWVREVWLQAGHPANGLPVAIVSPEGYGLSLPSSLQ
jgi:hypothetical protein